MWRSGSGGLVLGAEGLVGHRGPEEATELAGDGDGRDGRALAARGQAAVAVVQTDLGVPGARRDGGWHVGSEAGAGRAGGGGAGGPAGEPAGGGRCRPWGVGAGGPGARGGIPG